MGIFKKLFIKEDLYDDIFGVPSTRVWNTEDLLSYIDDVISYAEEKPFDVESYFVESETPTENTSEGVKRVVVSSSFEKAVKLLYKKHKTDTLEELKKIIVSLSKFEISTQKHNHPLKNAQGFVDIHLEGGGLILLYKYESEEVMSLAFTEDSISRILALQDIVNHKQLSKYKYPKSTKNFFDWDIDNMKRKDLNK